MSPWEHNLQQYLSGIFTFASWTTADPSISTGSLSFLKELSNYFLLPCDRPTLGRLLGPECLDVLVLFSPGLQKTTGFMLNLNSIIVSVWFCCLMLVFFFFFFVKGQKQFGFRSKCIRSLVWDSTNQSHRLMERRSHINIICLLLTIIITMYVWHFVPGSILALSLHFPPT